jgi:hypothetical protein
MSLPVVDHMVGEYTIHFESLGVARFYLCLRNGASHGQDGTAAAALPSGEAAAKRRSQRKASSRRTWRKALILKDGATLKGHRSCEKKQA